ncbi:NmrA-like family protein [Cadophora sp. MPI-SDFR-AT-0126]|nr:NmrA-like family protein [Leotiomycetes sp. MPI-SDFR-AT-0126]
MSSPIKNVIVIGASGAVGRAAISALLSTGFKVSALIRESSNATFPPDVNVHKTDYSLQSLLNAFKGQDAIVSAIATGSAGQQMAIIDAAIISGVRRFIPSEFGIDTADPRAGDFVPALKVKQDTVKYLQTKESSGLSWTAIVVGSLFDWTFQYPGLMGWNLPQRKATIFDGGEYEFEATNLSQMGLAIAACLKPEYFESTKNQHVYVNSFTVTQSQILAGFEKLLGYKLEVEGGNAADLGVQALAAIERGEGRAAHLNTIVAAIYGNGGLNNYSKTRGLWNGKLGLSEEKLGDSLARIVDGLGDGK